MGSMMSGCSMAAVTVFNDSVCMCTVGNERLCKIVSVYLRYLAVVIGFSGTHLHLYAHS